MTPTNNRRISRAEKLKGLFKSISKNVCVRKILGSICFLGILGLILFSYISKELVQHWRLIHHEPQANHFLSTLRKTDRRLLVNTTNCQIPSWDPWDPTVYPNFEIMEPEQDCSEKTYNWSSVKSNVLTLHVENMVRNGYDFYPGFCCYRTALRVQQKPDKYDKEADKLIKISDKCISLETPKTVISSEYIVVECGSTLSKLTPFPMAYRSFHTSPVAGAALSEKVQKKFDYWKKKSLYYSGGNKTRRPPNILVIGLDSTSRLQFSRFMPLTKSFFEQIGAVEMLGYTKVGDNTYLNLVPILTGYSVPDLHEVCHSSQFEKYDNCPIIWKRMQEAKYLTSHIEDTIFGAVFNYFKTGFVKKPVDFYLRPLFLTASEYGGISRTDPNVYCVGQFMNDQVMTSYMEEILDIGEINRTPVFASSMSTIVSHDAFNGIQLLDGYYSDFFSRLHQKGYLENTIFFFFGDHGYRYGGFRNTLMGFYEDKLPNMWVYIPPRIRNDFPHWNRALKVNSKRVSSAFCVYWTINHILEKFSQLPPPRDNSAVSREHRFSFFNEIPEPTSCDDMGVPHEFCACNPLRPLPLNDPHLLKAAKITTEYINKNILSNSSCSPLKVQSISTGAKKVDNKSGSVEYFVVQFVVTPGSFLISGEVGYDEYTKTFEKGSLDNPVNVQRASKINPSHVHCLTDVADKLTPQRELYCYCQ